jgi:hypothetical protein
MFAATALAGEGVGAGEVALAHTVCRTKNRMCQSGRLRLARGSTMACRVSISISICIICRTLKIIRISRYQTSLRGLHTCTCEISSRATGPSKGRQPLGLEAPSHVGTFRTFQGRLMLFQQLQSSCPLATGPAARGLRAIWPLATPNLCS